MKNVKKNLASVANFFNAEYVGDPGFQFESAAPAAEAGSKDISAIFSQKYKNFLIDSNAGILIVDAKLGSMCKRNVIIVANPRLVFAKIVRWLNPKPEISAGLHSTCVIGDDCSIADDVSCGPHVSVGDRVSIGSGVVIGPGVSIGNDVSIGEGTYLHAGVRCYSNTLIGDNCIIHSNTVIGADGFGLVIDDDNSWLRVPQQGRVRIGKGVEIGSNSTVDCATFNETILSDGVKLGSHVMIGHNVFVGKHTLLACKSSVGGSSQIGAYCLAGGEVSISDNLILCDKVTIAAGSQVPKSISVSGVYASFWPVLPHKQWLRFITLLMRSYKKERVE